MANPELFRPKNQDQLREQVLNISSILSESITPPSKQDGILDLSVDSLKQRFSERYRIYVDALRRDRVKDSPHPFAGHKLRTLNRLDRYIEAHYNNPSFGTLLDRQMTVFEDIRDFLESGGRAGYIKLPTAAGKTVLFTELIEATGLQALVVMPTKVLIDQTGERFQQFAPGVEVGKVYQDAKEYGRQVTLTTYDSFMDKVESGDIVPEDFIDGLLVLDEGHRALTPRRRYTVGLFKEAIKLGFTATPKYATNKELRDLLNYEIHSMDIPEAVELRLLSPLSVYLAQTDIDLSNVRITADGDYDERDLDRAINITSRNIAAVEVYQQLFSGQKTVAYCVGIKHAEALAKAFNDRGIAADFINGQQTRSEQQDRLRRFKNGEIKILCNANILIEGFDEPSAIVCLNLRPTMSAVVAEQRGGRVLRLDPNSPTKHAIIVDFVGKDYSAGSFVGKNPPITFSQILEKAEIFKKADPYEGQGLGRYTIRYPNVEISGITVITDAQEVMRLTREVSGITEEGWYRTDALLRRFRITEDYLLRLLNPLREAHPEYFEIKVLRGDPKEYLSPDAIRILQRRIGPIESRKNIQGDYLELTQAEIIKLFIGTWKTLQPLVEGTAWEIAEKYPDMVIRVMGKGGIRQICKDRQIFISLMKEKGVKEKRENSEEESGFAVSSNNLQKNFVGSTMDSLKIAREVVEELRKEDPDLVEDIYRGVQRIPNVKNRRRFIEAMKKKGALYREDQKVKGSEMIVTGLNLETVFFGSGETLRPIAQEIIEEMRRDSPDLVRNIAPVSQHVIVVDRGIFTAEMKKIGIILRDEARLEQSDFAITQRSVKIFKGHHTRVKVIAEEIGEQLKQENPELVTVKYSGSKRVTVVRDKNRLIEEMRKRGIELKSHAK